MFRQFNCNRETAFSDLAGGVHSWYVDQVVSVSCVYGGLIVGEEFSPITSNFSSVSDENECGGKLAMRAKVVKYEFEFDTRGVSLACMARIAAM